MRNCLTDEGRPLGCAKKKCKLHAVREMREGPSKPLCRERLQTATSCCGTMATVVNVVVKSVDRPRQVGMRETNASEPPIKHRNLLRRRQNRGLRGAPGSVWWKPVYWPDGVSEPLNSYSSHHGAMPRAHLPSGRTTPERYARCARSSVSPSEDGDAASCISAWPRGPDLGPVRALSGKAPSDNIARSIGSSLG